MTTKILIIICILAFAFIIGWFIAFFTDSGMETEETDSSSGMETYYEQIIQASTQKAKTCGGELKECRKELWLCQEELREFQEIDLSPIMKFLKEPK